jgi:glycosyltransferase involved in cell wall biosynthesis
LDNFSPLVSVVCLCYNHKNYVTEALLSVINQDYPNIQLIVVDDASTDGSVAIIKDFIKLHPNVHFIPLKKNKGNCKAFNEGLKQTNGDFIIDLAADDVLMPNRVSEGVRAFAELGNNYGVHFSDGEYINKQGKALYIHSTRYPHATIPQGDIYRDVIERFFICPPTVMFRKEVIQYLGGYDETLGYEDFDFWIRSSRSFWYCYSPLVLVKKRVLKGSLSSLQFRTFSPQLYSTFEICKKIMLLNKTEAEQKALSNRILYEAKVALKVVNFQLAWKYVLLLYKNHSLKYK